MTARPWLIKSGGELLVEAPIRRAILLHIKKYAKKTPLVFVHGGGPQIEEELKRSQIEAHFSNGRRVTSPEAMVVVERVLSGQINKAISAELGSIGVRSAGLSSRDGKLITATPIAELGRAGKPAKLDTRILSALMKAGFVPVVSSVGSDKEGQPININADDAASAMAIDLKVERLVFLTNIAGVLDQNKKTIPILKTSQIDSLINTGVITGGMIPKVQSARAAILKGVGEVDILNGKEGINFQKGTRIVKS